MPTVLVTGGAGYVGSTTVLHLRSLGWRVVVFDNLRTGHPDLAAHADAFVQGDLLRPEHLGPVFRSEAFDGVIHCAARSLVGESVREPLTYFEENIQGAVHLIRACRVAGDVPIVFSSSAAVYGEPERVPVREDDPKRPVSPYGFSKLAIEEALRAVDRAHGLRSVSLRYFNAAGADPLGRAGERHDPETHILPILIAAGTGEDDSVVSLFGDDYPTRDGSCVRDFVHVLDLARGHQQALEYLWRGGETAAINLGSGAGFTVREVAAAVREAVGVDIPLRVSPRREGDPAVLLADITCAREVLGWLPQHSGIGEIIRDALQWHRGEARRHHPSR